MKFSWENFKEESFNVACDLLKENEGNEDYVGSVRIGDLCFDILTREYNDKLYLDYDLYVGGVDTGYGYSDDYPYDYAGGGSFNKSCVNMTYEEFRTYAEEVMAHYIKTEEKVYEHASLVAKAEEELNVW